MDTTDTTRQHDQQQYNDRMHKDRRGMIEERLTEQEEVWEKRFEWLQQEGTKETRQLRKDSPDATANARAVDVAATAATQATTRAIAIAAAAGGG